MNQFIDVKRITDSLYIEDQSEVIIELPVYTECLTLVPSVTKIKVPTSSYVFNVPTSHYVMFRGINTNISITAVSGVLDPSKNGILFIDVINLSLEEREIPCNLKLGSLCIKTIPCLLKIHRSVLRING